MTGWTFLVADLVSGQVNGELPMRISGPLTRLLQQPGSGKLELPVYDERTPDDWETLTLPWRSMFLVVDDSGAIAWHGIPKRAPRSSGKGKVEYPCTTAEGYFDRRFVPTLDFVDQDQTSVIAHDLAAIAADGFGIGLELDTPASGRLREKHYHDDEDARVLERLQQLAGVIDGFEWTVDVDWGDSTKSWVEKVYRTGYPHLGTVTDTPDTVWETGLDVPKPNIIGYDHDVSWADGDAATHVRASGDGEGDDRTLSAPVVDTAAEGAGWPRLEARRNYSGVTDQDTIEAHAGSMAAELFGGQEITTVEVRADVPPKFGTYSLGDAAWLQISDGLTQVDVVRRIVGWELRPKETKARPIIAKVTEQTGS